MPGEKRSVRRVEGVSDKGYLNAPTIPSPPVSPAARSTMLANRRRDTGPELAIRSRLHRAGLRYRVDRSLPFDRRRRADLVFTRVGLYVFIDGCFWHGCPEHFTIPKTRTDFWVGKIEGNRRRDRDTDERLGQLGLVSLRVWEHMDPDTATEVVLMEYRRLAVSLRGDNDGARGAHAIDTA
jgi:DNA mismatch endonuclease, patch repair protein